MQCPRCGLVNQPGITACARCGLPAPQTRPSGQGQPGEPGQPAQPGPTSQPQGRSTAPTLPGEPAQQGWRSGPYPPPTPHPPGAPRPPVHPGQQGRGGQGYGQPGYGQPGYGQQGYAQPGYTQGTQPIPQQGHPTWPVGASAPPGSTASTSRTASSPDSTALAAVVALAAGALLSLVYAVWAFTARRGIFADFSNGTPVSSDHAKSSDRIDTVLLVVAGVVVIAALALWVTRMTSGRTSGGALDVGGLAAAAVGVVIVLVGLFLSSRISDGIDQAAQGDRGVTATVVTGAGFLVIALALAVGVIAVRGGRAGTTGRAGQSGSSTYAPPAPGGSQGW